jgi:hypothetical protein
MKYLLLVLVLISSSVSFNASANERQLIQELQSSNEPWAKDAMMSGPRHLYVGKYNLGTREDGYAAVPWRDILRVQKRRGTIRQKHRRKLGNHSR